MKTNEQISALVNAAFADRHAAFRPCAFFDDRLDCIRIVTRDCSVTEMRVSDLITILEMSHPPHGKNKCVGFTVKGARHFCNQHGFNLSAPLKMSALLDALMKSAPSLVVQTIIERIVKPLVEEANLDHVEPSPAYKSIPQTI
ncbi:MAG: hypothetical protein WCE61_00385 [Candidatus Acidiferrum sp.]